MWKYISGVSKVVEEKKKEKAPKAACDQSKEYEKSRTRKFSTKWQVGRPWLKNDEEKGMICEWCVANKQTLIAQNVLNSMAALAIKRSRFRITRNLSTAHLLAKQCHRANLCPEKKPSKPSPAATSSTVNRKSAHQQAKIAFQKCELVNSLLVLK